jgi:hypothetical protein
MEHSSRADLAKCVDTYQMGSLFYGADFPALPDDYHVVTEKFLRHVAGKINCTCEVICRMLFLHNTVMLPSFLRCSAV